MNAKRTATALNLPVLLSFNELAWIVLFAMGMVSAYTWRAATDARRERDQAMAQVTSLGGNTNELALAFQRALEERDAARRDQVKAAERVKDLEAQSARLARELQSTRTEIARLSTEAARLLQNLEDDRQRHANLTQELEETRRREKQLALDLERLLNSQTADGTRLSALLASLSRVEASNRALSNEVQRLRLGGPGSERAVRQELVGLQGRMTNVVILLDRSESMTNASRVRLTNDRAAPTASRWNVTLSVIEAWLRHLPVERCVLIAYNNTPTSFPKAGMLEVGGRRISSDQAQRNRETLIASLRSLTPNGATDTYAALLSAYSYSPDSIVLFTDGEPTTGPAVPTMDRDYARTRDVQQLQKNILALASAHAGTPINTIAVGEYYRDRGFAQFLIQLSEATGGVFLGR